MKHWIRRIHTHLSRVVSPRLARPGARPPAARFQPRVPTPAECRLLAVGGLAMLGLLLALAWTCQASMERGERLRAEQRALSAGR